MSALESQSGDVGFEVSFEDIPIGLHARVFGFGGFEETVASWREILVEVRKRNPAALLLIDELHGNPLTGPQWHALVEAMRGQGLEQTRIAHVKPAGRNSIEFCELFARGIGIDARVFEDEEAAVLWLEYEGKDGFAVVGRRDYGELSISRDLDLPGILRVQISGRSGDAVSILRAWQEVLDSVRKTGKLQLLAVLDMHGDTLPERELTAVVTRLAGLAPKGLRIALLEMHGNRQHYDERATLLAMERGFNVAVFADEASALPWLRYGEG